MIKLVETLRGPIVENIHFGSIIVTDTTGKFIAKAGDDITTYLRSAAKPLQLIPLVESNAIQEFGFTDKELAIMAGSHYGTEEHALTIAGILNKLNLPPEALKCGIHAPFSRAYAKELQAAGKTPSVLNNNCSGKHAAMLALCKLNDWDIDSYLSPSHPVQNLMCKTVSEMSGVPENNIFIGIDGCGVPVFGLPLSAMATSFAKLGLSQDLPEKRRLACLKIAEVMHKYPEMIAGEGALDTALLALPHGKIICKIGAEAVYCISLPDKGIGIAIKISDGNMRILSPVVVEALIQLNVLTPEDILKLEKFRSLPTKNFAGNIVGETRPNFSLQYL